MNQYYKTTKNAAWDMSEHEKNLHMSREAPIMLMSRHECRDICLVVFGVINVDIKQNGGKQKCRNSCKKEKKKLKIA